MSNVEFRDIVKKYGSLTVLERLNLRVDDGEFLVLLGPSGCGKTTLLNILAGLMEIDGGEIFIGDREVSVLDPKDRGLAMVFQSYALYPTKTVRGNLKFGLSARNLTNAEINLRIAWAAKLLQIDHLLDRKPPQLSGGQRQRVAIGRALVKQVDVCLFDEPLSNLDAKLRTEMRLEIKKLHNELRNTVIYVTHDQVEAMTMATKIAIMDKGVIQQFGTPDEIYDTPENAFVADFVGSPSMNMLDCVLRGDGTSLVANDATSGLAFDLADYAWRAPAREGQRVRVGFRPEHFIQPGEGSSGRSLQLDLPVQFLERSGPETIAFLPLQQKLIAVRVQSHATARFKQGSAVSVQLPLNKINVFDAETGRRM